MHLLIVGGSRADRGKAVAAQADAAGLSPSAVVTLDAATLPFVRPETMRLTPPAPRLIRIVDIERAFPDAQKAGTRLVLTQSTYLLRKWTDLLDDRDQIIAAGDRKALTARAPEAFAQRGAWRPFEVLDLERKQAFGGTKTRKPGSAHSRTRAKRPSALAALLSKAFASPSPAERLKMCRTAVESNPGSEVAALAFASACRERQRLSGARAGLDAAIRLAPDWEAAHYENGKFWLACDDLAQARDAFQRAAALMPGFSAAYSNLGATLGELGEPGAALAAFTHALTDDPASFTLLNNVAVVNRELGRLAESEAAARRVVSIAPEFVFGHYNLGHTLFLAGRFADALAAYEEGQRLDPERNRRQGCRLAMVRFANGDVAGAERDLWAFANSGTPEEREDLLLEAYEIAQAILGAKPELAGHHRFLDSITAEIRRADEEGTPNPVSPWNR